MCGHVGIAGDLVHKDTATIKKMLVLDYYRGPDSTGIAQIKGKEAALCKVASHPFDLFDTLSFGKVSTAYGSDAFIGHNRAATRGLVNKTNAHPYHIGSIIGAHNGTLTQESFKALEDLAGETFPVDSMAIFAAIDKVGIEATVKEMTGAWSLVWFDQSDGTLNFLRNKERPMWWSWTKKFDKLFWASEYWMLEQATPDDVTSPYDMYVEDETNYKYWPTEENKLYTFDLAVLKKGAKERPNPIMGELLGKPPAPIKVTPATAHPFTQHKTSTTQSLGTCDKGDKESKKARTVVHLFVPDDSPFGNALDAPSFELLAMDGCSWCGNTVNYADLGLTVFVRGQHVLCPTCSGQGTAAAPRLIVPAVTIN